MDIASGGWHGRRGFNTLSLSLKSTSVNTLPRDFFMLLKDGVSNERTQNIYNINNLSTEVSSYAEVAFGHSREFAPGLRIGAKAKFLVGLAHLKMDVDAMSVDMSAQRWKISNLARFQSSGFDVRTLADGTLTTEDMNLDPKANGLGVAFDLGISWEIIKDLTVSLSINDLGFISWKTDEYHTSAAPFEITPFGEVESSGEGLPLEDQLSALGDDVEAMFDFYEYKMGARSSVATPTMINIGGEYGWADNMISLGLLASAQFHGRYTWMDVMLSANYRPWRWFTLGVNGSYSNMGHSFGGLLNFTSRGFNVFVGANMMSLKFNSSVAPLPMEGLQSQVSLGMNFMLFKNRQYKKLVSLR